jgi:hypothetical protein
MMVDYPPAVARKSAARQDAWIQSYVSTVFQMDIRDLANIAGSTAVPRLLSVVAARAGGLLNFADLSRTMALPQTTLKRYFALLEATFLVQLLRPWARKLRQRAIQTPKVFLRAIDASAGSHGGPPKGRGECGRIGIRELCVDGTAQAMRLERDPAGTLLLADGLRPRG